MTTFAYKKGQHRLANLSEKQSLLLLKYVFFLILLSNSLGH